MRQKNKKEDEIARKIFSIHTHKTKGLYPEYNIHIYYVLTSKKPTQKKYLTHLKRKYTNDQ